MVPTNPNTAGHMVIVKSEEQPQAVKVNYTNNNFDPTKFNRATTQVIRQKNSVVEIPANGNVATTMSDALRDKENGNKTK